MNPYEKVIRLIDWALLRKQKGQLLLAVGDAIAAGNNRAVDLLEGLVSMIDNIQDVAADHGVGDDVVFHREVIAS